MTPERKALDALRNMKQTDTPNDYWLEIAIAISHHMETIRYALQAIETIGRENIERLLNGELFIYGIDYAAPAQEDQ